MGPIVPLWGPIVPLWGPIVLLRNPIGPLWGPIGTLWRLFGPLRDPIWGLLGPQNPGDPFFQNPGPPEAAGRSTPWVLGPLKNMILFRNGPPNPDFGESRDPTGLYGVQEVFGRARFPPNPTKPYFLGNFLVLGSFGQGPWAGPIGPL